MLEKSLKRYPGDAQQAPWEAPQTHLEVKGNSGEAPREIQESRENPLGIQDDTQETPRMHPGVTQEAPRGRPRGTQAAQVSQRRPDRHQTGTQETPRRHPGGTKEANRHPRDTQEALRRHQRGAQGTPKRRPKATQEVNGTSGAPKRETRDTGNTSDPRPGHFALIFMRVKLKSDDSTAEWRQRHSSSATPAHKHDWKNCYDNNGASPGS